MSDLKLISNNGSQKYALQVTIKGREYLFTKIKNNLALIPVSENRARGQILAWDTPAQVKEFLDEIKKKYPDEFARIWNMKPDIVKVDIVQ